MPVLPIFRLLRWYRESGSGKPGITYSNNFPVTVFCCDDESVFQSCPGENVGHNPIFRLRISLFRKPFFLFSIQQAESLLYGTFREETEDLLL
jgi:hypothetical protein